MKKNILLILMLCFPAIVKAYDAYIGGIYYYLDSNNKTATVTFRYQSEENKQTYMGDVIIPSDITYKGVSYGVTAIGNTAFYQCSALTSITIPSSVTRIEQEAFSGCSGLTSIAIPSSVTSIGSGAFRFCSGLNEIKVDKDNMVYDSRDNCNAIIQTETNTLLYGCNGTIIPNGVTSIGPYAFSGCNGLTSITIPEDMTSIGDYAFSHFTGLTSINIPESVTSIGYAAFYGCTGLTSITIPTSITGIGEYAFSNCTGLKAVYIDDLEAWCKINFSSFSNPLEYAHHLFLNDNEITHLEIPSNTTEIGQFTFYGLSALTSITIPESVTSIGTRAFSGCTGLTSITVPKNVTSFGHSVFSDCKGELIIYCDIPDGDGAFASSRFSNIKIYASKVGNNAFYNHSSITSIEIGRRVTSIGSYAFAGCKDLASINIPSNVLSLGENAFYNCSTLSSCTINSSNTKLGRMAFRNCPRLNNIYCLCPAPPNCEDQIFICGTNLVRDPMDVYNYAMLHIPIGTRELYSSAYEWRYFKNVKEDIELNVDGKFADLIIKMGGLGYTRQAVKANETFAIYIGSLGDNRVNTVLFNGVDVTNSIIDGYFTTPEINGESELSISFESELSVKSMNEDNLRISGYNCEIRVQNIEKSSDIYVYSMDGKLVDCVLSAIGSASIQVASEQLYLVKVGNRSFKVAL